MLRYYAGWPDPQIAAPMGISGRALNAYIRRGMSPSRPVPTPTQMAPDLERRSGYREILEARGPRRKR